MVEVLLLPLQGERVVKVGRVIVSSSSSVGGGSGVEPQGQRGQSEVI